jgi:hypothetical protein
MVYGILCTKCQNFVTIVQLTWPPYAVHVCDWPIKNHLAKVITIWYGMFCIKFHQSKITGDRYNFSPLGLFSYNGIVFIVDLPI